MRVLTKKLSNRRNSKRKARSRKLQAEQLELRRMLASDFTNAQISFDVSADGFVTPIDVLLVVNDLNRNGARELEPATEPVVEFIDPSGDGFVSPLDALLVINVLNLDSEPPIISLGLENDTAFEGTNDDLITFDPTIGGIVEDQTGVNRLQVVVDGGTPQNVDFSFETGAFSFDPRSATEEFGDGSHTFQFIATDALNRTSAPARLTFELDTIAPILNADLASTSDSGVVGDRLTSENIVDLLGTTDPNTNVRIGALGLEVQSNEAGDFSFEAIALATGLNAFDFQANDIAGNSNTSTQRFLRSESDAAFGLIEGANSAIEVVQDVDLGEIGDPRQIRVSFSAAPTPRNGNSDLDDTLNVYLVDADDPSQTLIDGGIPGQPIFSLTATNNKLTPGISSFDGNDLLIDASSVAGANGKLLFQLLSADIDISSIALIEDVVSEAAEEGIPFPLPTANLLLPGPAIDLTGFAPNADLEVQVSEPKLNSATGRFDVLVQVVNRGLPIGRNVVLSLPSLPEGVTVNNASGVIGDAPFLNLKPAISNGGLGTGQVSLPVTVSIDNPENRRFVLDFLVHSGEANRAPVFETVDSIRTLPGDASITQLVATDEDGDDLTFTLTPKEGQSNGPPILLTNQGLLTVRPGPDNIGTFEYEVQVSDGAETVSQTITINVAEDDVKTTRVSGRVLDTNRDPIPGITVNLGSATTLTDAQGAFLVEEPAGGFDADALEIHGEEFSGEFVFPFVAEKLPLLFEGGRDLILGVNNVVDRPIYLPPLDVAGGTEVDPTQDITVTQTIAPGDIAEVFVAADTLKDQQGEDFTGTLSITEVPRNLTPAALPAGVFPGTVVTIQPGEMSFQQPAPLTLPNRGGFDPGTEMDLFSINPTTGQFDNVGTGRVSSNGQSIETIEGGIINSSWHFFTPATAGSLSNLLRQQAQNIANQEDDCARCEALAQQLRDRAAGGGGGSGGSGAQTAATQTPTLAPPATVGGGQVRDNSRFQVRSFATSEVELHSGALREQHNLVSYRSLETERGLSLQYNSQRADIRPIVHFGVDQADGDFLVAKATVRRGATSFEVPGVPEGLLGLSGGEHLFRIPDGNPDIDAAIQLNLQDQPSGIYQVDVSFGVRQLGGDQLIGVDGQSASSVAVINSSNSPFGAGWNVAGLQELFENPDGSVLLFDAGGEELVFEPPRNEGAPLESPVGDFSTFEQLSDGTYRRTFTDQTVVQFNSENRVQSITDRNGNATTYNYDGDGFVTSIVDPAGLETTFTREGNRITKIADPGARETVLAYDDAGNLIRITDPDNTSRQFSYDERHKLTGEIDKRGLSESSTYGFHGRVTEVQRKDGARSAFQPLQTAGLFPASMTTTLENAPTLGVVDDSGTASIADPNGNVVETQLDQAGQVKTQSDEVGGLPSVVRDADNNAVVSFDGRGNSTVRDFDDRGNVTRVVQQLFDQNTNIFSGTHYDIGTSTARVRFGDLDGDGDLDAVSSNERTGFGNQGSFATTITVLENQGNGKLVEADSFQSGLTRTEDLELADINGDGVLDALLTGQQGFSSLLGNGDLSFGEFSLIAIAEDVRKFDFGDLNDDGDLDVAIARENLGGDDLVLLFGDGAGGFTQETLPVGRNSLDVAIADFDQDGRNDIAVGTIGDVRLFRARQDAGFDAPEVVSFVTANYFSIETADLNRNGIPDLAAGTRGVIHSLLNVGDGTFRRQNGVLTGQGNDAVNDIAVQDLNGDAFPEIVITLGVNSNGPIVFENQGFGQFETDARTQYFTSANVEGIDLGDIDKDGDLDFIVANASNGRSNGGLTVLEGFADGRFNQSVTPATNGVDSVAAELADINGDHLLDLVTLIDGNASVTDTSVSIQFGSGNGKFSNEQVIPVGLQDVTDLSFGDYNNDGFTDLAVVARRASSITVLFQDANGNFAPELITTSGSGGSVATADIDADGDDDIVATFQDPRRVVVAISGGDKSFSTTEIAADFTGRGQDAMRIADVNNDGNLDIIGITPNRFFAADNSIVVFGNGDGSFSGPTEFGTSIDSRAVAATDINGDGLADIVVVGKGLSVRLALEDGGFAAQSTTVFPGDVAGTELKLLDVNQDGNLDVLTLLDDENHLLVLAGAGDGTFDELGRFSSGDTLLAVDAGDLDFDGDADVVVTNAEVGSLTLMNQSVHVCQANCERLFEYDATFNQLTRTVDQLGRQVLFEVDPLTGNILSETVVLGQPDATSDEVDDLVTRMTYTSSGLIDTLSDPLGRITQFQYDAQGRQIAATVALGSPDEATTRFEYDDVGNIVAEIDEVGNRTEFEYDALNRVTLIRDALSGIQSFSYDANGNILEQSDALNQLTQFEYDEMNRVVREIDNLNGATSFEYDALGNLISETDRIGRTTQFVFDARSRLIEIVDPDGFSRKTVYDADNNRISETDKSGDTVRMLYDQRTLRTTMLDAVGGVLTARFDAVGNLLRMTDELGRTTDFAYDEANRQVETRQPAPDRESPEERPVTQFVYDKADNIAAEIDPLGNVTQFEFDNRNRLIERVDPDPDGVGPLESPTTTFEYDDRSLLTEIVDPLGDKLEYEYDALNRLTREIFPDPDDAGPLAAPVLTTVYNAVGQVTETIDALGNSTVFEYDSLNRLIEETEQDPDGAGPLASPVTTRQYDAAGQLLSVTDPLGRTVRTEYDNLGRITRIVSPELEINGVIASPIQQFGFDPDGNLILAIDPLGNMTQYEFDPLDRMVRVKDADPDGVGPLESPITTLIYDAAGQQTAEVDPLGRVSQFVYDDLGRVIENIGPDPDGAGPEILPVTKFQYDLVGNATAVIDPLGNTTQFAYDNLYREVLQRNPDPDGAGPLLSPTFESAYDAAGNLTATTDPLGRITTFAYDNLNRLVRQTTPDPDQDGPLAAPVTTFSYDAMSNIVATTDPLGQETRFEYDGLLRQISVTEADPDGTGPLAAPVSTIEYDSANQQVAFTDPLNRQTRFEYDSLGRQINVIEADPDGDGPLTNPNRQSVFDLLGNLIQIIDANGNVTEFQYDGLNRVVRQIEADPDAAGPLLSPETTFEYDAAGQLLQTSDPLQRTTLFEYDDLGRLTRRLEPDPDGNGPEGRRVSSLEYDLVGNVVAEIDPLGNRTQFEFDNLYRQIRTVQADPDAAGPLESPIVEFQYDSASNLVRSSDQLGRETTFQYDALDRKIARTDPDPDGDGPQVAPTTQYIFDVDSNLLEIIDSLGNSTRFEYDNLDRRIRMAEADPDGAGPAQSPVFTTVYDIASQVTTEIDSLGRDISFEYDALGRLIAIIAADPDGVGPQESPISRFAYDAVGNSIHTTDSNNNVTQFEYDGLNRQIRITDADPDGTGPLESPVTSFAFDAADQLLQVVDPLNRVTQFQYDDLGREVLRTEPDPDGTGPAESPTRATEYDLFGNALAITNALGQRTAFDYDNLYRRTSITDANGDVTAFAFDAFGNQITLTDALLNTTTFAYDGLNRVVTETNDLGDAKTFEYDTEDNLIRTVDRNGRVIEREYDDLYRRLSERWLESDNVIHEINFAYDSEEQLLSVEDTTATYTFEYDNLGRTARTTQDLNGLIPSIEMTRTFDGESNLLTTSTSIGGIQDYNNTYNYDGLNRPTQVVQQSSGGNAVADKRADFSFDDASQLETLRRFHDAAGTQSVADSAYQFDLAGRLISLEHSQAATELAAYQWSFDVGNRVTNATSLLDGDSNFTHDDRGQLTAATYDFQANESFQYDANGNRTGGGNVVGDNNRLLSDGTFNYDYDAEGNRTSRTNILTGAITEYEWDHRNRLVQVTERASAGGAATRTIRYAYDPFNQWTSKHVDIDGEGPAGEQSRFFVYDSGQIVLDFEGTNAEDLAHRYLWGNKVDQLLADESVDSLDVAGEVLWSLGDNLGSVRDLARYDATNDQTTIVNHRTYDSFGNLTAETDPTTDSLIGFTGRPFDDDTGLQNNLNRWYDPASGRWMSEDPIGFSAGDANLNRYVGNSPVDTTDPDGLRAIPNIEPGANDQAIKAFGEAFNQPGKTLRRSRLNDIVGDTAAGLIDSVDSFVTDTVSSLVALPGALYNGSVNLTEAWFIELYRSTLALSPDPVDQAIYRELASKGSDALLLRGARGIINLPKTIINELSNRLDDYNTLIGAGCQRQATKIFGDTVIDAVEAALIAKSIAKALAKGKGAGKAGNSKAGGDGPGTTSRTNQGPGPDAPKPNADAPKKTPKKDGGVDPNKQRQEIPQQGKRGDVVRKVKEQKERQQRAEARQDPNRKHQEVEVQGKTKERLEKRKAKEAEAKAEAEAAKKKLNQRGRFSKDDIVKGKPELKKQLDDARTREAVEKKRKFDETRQRQIDDAKRIENEKLESQKQSERFEANSKANEDLLKKDADLEFKKDNNDTGGDIDDFFAAFN